MTRNPVKTYLQHIIASPISNESLRIRLSSLESHMFRYSYLFKQRVPSEIIIVGWKIKRTTEKITLIFARQVTRIRQPSPSREQIALRLLRVHSTLVHSFLYAYCISISRGLDVIRKCANFSNICFFNNRNPDVEIARVLRI